MKRSRKWKKRAKAAEGELAYIHAWLAERGVSDLDLDVVPGITMVIRDHLARGVGDGIEQAIIDGEKPWPRQPRLGRFDV
jgi:hypothetical protein